MIDANISFASKIQAAIITASAKYAPGMLHAKKGPTEAKWKRTPPKRGEFLY